MGTIRICGGRIWDQTKFEKNRELDFTVKNAGDRELLLNDEDMILPGVLDMHGHIWAPRASTELCLAEELPYAEGVIATCDAGSFGSNDWEQANRYWMATAKQTIRSFMHIWPEGLTVFPITGGTAPKDISLEKLTGAARKDQNGNLLGFKLHLGFESAQNDLELLEVARKAADMTGLRIMLHISNAYLPFKAFARYLKKGDIISHVYSGRREPLLEDGHISPAYEEARARGVIMDVAHAGKHFSWKVFRRAMEEGAMFDTVGTDIAAISYKNKKRFLNQDIFHITSGLMNAGVPQEKVIHAITTAPAEIMGIRLDVTKQTLVLKKVTGEVRFYDDASTGDGDFITGLYEYRPVLFADNGVLISENL